MTHLATNIARVLAKRRPIVADQAKLISFETAARLRAFYYPKQNAFYTSRARFRATKKTRRAGATTGGCRELIARAIEKPGFRATYVTSTRVEARQRAWLSDTKSGLVDILRNPDTGAIPTEHPSLECFTLGGVVIKVYDQAMELEFSNGSKIDLFGADDERAMRKQRGLSKHVYWVDEAQDFRFLDRFFDAVIIGSLTDYQGECWLTGTPSRDCSGMFYEVTKDVDGGDGAPKEGWEVHTIASTDNPFFGRVVGGPGEDGKLVYWIEDNMFKENGEHHGDADGKPFTSFLAAEKHAQYIRDERTANMALKDQGWTRDNPDFIREWLGRWVREDARYVYPIHICKPYDLIYARQRLIKNPYKHVHPRFADHPDWIDVKKAVNDLPKAPKYNRRRQWMYAIGADFGFHPDPFALVVWAFSHESQDVYELFSWKATKVHTDDQGAYMRLLYDSLDAVVSFVGDPAGKQDDFAMWQERMQIPIEEANKRGKDVLEEFLANDIRKGLIHLRDGSPLHTEMKHLVYLPTKPGKKREAAKHRKSADGQVHGDHCCDAARYSYADLTHYMSKAPKENPKPGSLEALAVEEEKIEKKIDEREKLRESRMDELDDEAFERGSYGGYQY